MLAELRKRFFVATQRPPFTAAYRAAYDAALRLIVSRVAFRRGVAAVYLTSGMLDEPVYGLSDIDLTVIVDDERARGHVTNLLAQLRLVVPMLGPIDQQAVWTRAELATRLAGSPFAQYRLAGPRARLLLLGEDLLAAARTPAPPLRQALAEARFAWEVLRPVLAGQARADANHLFRKVLADVVRAMIFARSGEAVTARAACLDRAGALVDEPLLALARAPLAHPAIAPADAFRALHGVFAAWAAELPVEPPERELILEGPETTAPSVWLDAGIEDRPGCAAPRRHRVLDAPPGDAELRAFCAGPPLTVELGDVILPFGEPVAFGVALRPTHPEMFGATRLSAARHAFAADLISARRASLAALLDSRAVFRHDEEALRILCCAARERADDRGLTVPASLAAEPPAAAPELMRRLCERLGRDPAALLGDAAASHTMAVLICTRDRADLLRGALESIAAQRRPADQVVVLDNGSRDHTRAVVDAFRDRLPITYGHLAEPSIPAARNAALRLATADLLCFIDDDATADPGWLAAFEETFRSDPRIGVVGGRIWPSRTQRGAIADFHRWMQDGR